MVCVFLPPPYSEHTPEIQNKCVYLLTHTCCLSEWTLRNYTLIWLITQLDLKTDLWSLQWFSKVTHYCPAWKLSVWFLVHNYLKINVFFFFSNLCLDFLVRLDGSRFAHHHPSLHIFSLQPTNQSAQVISCFCPFQRLVEHLNTWKQQGDKRGISIICTRINCSSQDFRSYSPFISSSVLFPLTCNHRFKAAIVPHKFSLLSLFDDPSLQSAWHHCAPSWDTNITALKFTSSNFARRKVKSTHFNATIKKCTICLTSFSDLQWNKPLQWGEGTVYPALFWAEEHRNPQSPRVLTLHSYQD